MNWSGISRRTSLARCNRPTVGLNPEVRNWLKGTNWTMSRTAFLPDTLVSTLLSESSSSMDEKSALPMPTMMMDNGRLDELTIVSLVS